MIEVQITPQDFVLSDLLSSMEMLGTKFMPNTFKAIQRVTQVIAYTWKSYAMGAPIPGSSRKIKNPTGNYARSIKIAKLTPFNNVVYSDSQLAEAIENGTEMYDMKKTHPFGPKSRVTKDGDPYLVIPFRHGAPSSKSYAPIPEKLYAKIREDIRKGEVKLSARVKGRKATPNAEGKMIPRAKYNWGSKVDAEGDLKGLVVMDTSSKTSQRSSYMTFRIISVNSPAHKWISPARPAMNITKHVVENTRKIVNEIMSAGIKKDIGLP